MFSECIATMAQLPVGLLLVVAEQLQQQYLEVGARCERSKRLEVGHRLPVALSHAALGIMALAGWG